MLVVGGLESAIVVVVQLKPMMMFSSDKRKAHCVYHHLHELVIALSIGGSTTNETLYILLP